MATTFVSRFSFKARLTAVNHWSTADIRRLRELAARGLSVPAIAAQLSRSASAIRNKAGQHGISLRQSSARGRELDAVPHSTQERRVEVLPRIGREDDDTLVGFDPLQQV